MYFMHLDEFQIVSSSPEILARLENGVITTDHLQALAVAATTTLKTLHLKQNSRQTLRKLRNT